MRQCWIRVFYERWKIMAVPPGKPAQAIWRGQETGLRQHSKLHAPFSRGQWEPGFEFLPYRMSSTKTELWVNWSSSPVSQTWYLLAVLWEKLWLLRINLRLASNRIADICLISVAYQIPSQSILLFSFLSNRKISLLAVFCVFLDNR